jgi:Patatin-like phospholipase
VIGLTFLVAIAGIFITAAVGLVIRGDLRNSGIKLRMMTTCLTWGRPFTLPFTTGAFYFSPDEFSDFFPPEVVQWLANHPPKQPKEPHEPVDTGGLLPMPDWDDLPVIVAARFSLSFPFLFCTVPLYAVDWTLRRCKEGEKTPEPNPGCAIPFEKPRVPEHVWFTDGGICNNFPLHLFDAPVPRWPTFGIDLTHVRPDRKPTDSRIWMPRSNGVGINPDWTRLSDGPFGAVKLVVAIIDAARNWVGKPECMVRIQALPISVSAKSLFHESGLRSPTRVESSPAATFGSFLSLEVHLRNVARIKLSCLRRWPNRSQPPSNRVNRRILPSGNTLPTVAWLKELRSNAATICGSSSGKLNQILAGSIGRRWRLCLCLKNRQWLCNRDAHVRNSEEKR